MFWIWATFLLNICIDAPIPFEGNERSFLNVEVRSSGVTPYTFGGGKGGDSANMSLLFHTGKG